MSDVSQGPGWWIASDGKWYAPELHPDVQPSVPESPLIEVDTSTERSSGASRPLLLALVGLIALGALGFLGFRLLSGGGAGAGASSPEAAVQGLIDSVNEGDAVGLLSAFDPEEADAWFSSFSPFVSELNYAGFDTTAPDDRVEEAYSSLLTALSLSVTGPDGADPSYEVTTLAEGHLARVRVLGLDMAFESDEVPTTTIIGGTSSGDASGFDATALAGISATIRDDGRGIRGTVTNADGETEEDYAEDAHLDLVAIERDGEWYISVGYTMLELVRVQGGMNSAVLPDFGAALRAVEEQQGAATPEDAVRNLFAAVETVDLNEAVAIMDPVALPYLHDYLPMIDAEVSPADRREVASTFNLRIDDLKLGQNTWEGRTVVTIDRIAGGIGEGGSFIFDFDTWCGKAESQGDVIEGCAQDAVQQGLDELGDTETQPNDLLPQDFGFVVEERNGTWFVHPQATFGYLLDQAASSVRDFVESNAGAFEAEGGDAGTEAFFLFEGPIARGSEAVTAEPNDGVAAAATHLGDHLVDAGTGDPVGAAMVLITTSTPGTIGHAFGSEEVEAGQYWGFAVDQRGAEDFELPAFSVITEGAMTVELFDPQIVRLDESGYDGAIRADGRPLVFQAPISPAGSLDVAVFGASYRTVSSWDDEGIMLLPGAESFDWVSNGDFIVVHGDPGTEFQILVS